MGVVEVGVVSGVGCWFKGGVGVWVCFDFS